MKAVILIGALFGSVAFASPQYFCTADGYNKDNKLMSVSGKSAPTIEEAEASAKETCRLFGYSACRVQSCFQTGI